MKNPKIKYIDEKATMLDGKYQHIELCNTKDSTNRNLLLCHHCMGRVTFSYPLSINGLVALIRSFGTEHNNCKP